MRPPVAAVLLVFFSLAASADDRAAKWAADLDALVSGLEQNHKNCYAGVTREQFAAAVKRVREKLPTLKDHEILIEFTKLTARVGDSHTSVAPGQGAAVQFRRFPLRVVWLKDGLFVFGVPRGKEPLLKARLTAVDGTPIEQVLPKLDALAASENESNRKQHAVYWLPVAEALHAQGVTKRLDRATFAVEKDGKPVSAELTAGDPEDETPAFAVDWGKTDTPVWLQFSRPWYGSRLTHDGKVLYLWYDRCRDMPGRPVSEWAEAVLGRLDADKPERVVLDLRRNGGGSSLLLRPLVRGLAARAEAYPKGKVFALVGRRTFSSAMMNALELRTEAAAVLVGEPTGGSPNHFGEVRSFPLPHSKWQVFYSTKYFKLTADGATTITPDVAAEPAAAEFFAGADPVLEAAVKHAPKDE